MICSSRRFGAALFALTLVLAACGSDSAPSGSSASTGSGPTTGKTIKIGYVNNEGGAISLPEYRIGGEVAADYINAHGGINGAHISIVECKSDGSPEGSINCANQLIQANVVLAYTGIDVASDAALPLYKSAGIPYVSTTGWGPAQRNDDDSFLLHTAAAAYGVAPLATLKKLGAVNIAVLDDQSSPAGQSFMSDIVEPAAAKLGLHVIRVPYDIGSPDFTQVVTSALASHPDGLMAQLDESGCIGLVTATSTLGFKGPVLPGSCSGYIDALGSASAGTYVFSPVYTVDTREFAPQNVQANLDTFQQAMKDAGHEDLVGGFAAVPFSGMNELASVLKTISGEVSPASVAAAFRAATLSPGFLGSDLHCGNPPVASERSACRGDLLAFKIVIGADGKPKKEQVGDGFQDVASLLK